MMNLKKKCPCCSRNTLSLLLVVNILITKDTIECNRCKAKIQINKNKGLPLSVLWFIEAVMYLSLCALALYYKSWLVLSFGLFFTFFIEIILLQFVALKMVGQNDNVDQVF